MDDFESRVDDQPGHGREDEGARADQRSVTDTSCRYLTGSPFFRAG